MLVKLEIESLPVVAGLVEAQDASDKLEGL